MKKKLIFVIFLFVIFSSFVYSDNYNQILTNPNEITQKDLDVNPPSIDTTQTENNFSARGYIIEFKEKPLALQNSLANGLSTSSVVTEETLRKNHQLYIKDINEKVNDAKAEGDDLFVFNLGLFLGKITGNVVAEEEETVKPSAEYFNAINGVLIESLTSQQIDAIKSSSYVKEVYPNLVAKVNMLDSLENIGAKNASMYDKNFNLCSQTGMPCLTGQGVRVAILDTGIDYTHPDLGSCNPRYDIINGTVQAYELETAHNYNDNNNTLWQIRIPGFSSIRVHFTRIGLHYAGTSISSSDRIVIYNSTMGEVETYYGYTGNIYDIWSSKVNGDTMYLGFFSNSNTNDFGFKIDKALDGDYSYAYNWTGCRVIGGYDFVNKDGDPMDDHYHGTHVAGTIAGNGTIKGVAPLASIYAYKVLDFEGSGTIADILSAIEMAVDPNKDGNFNDRADIISMSLGVDCESFYGEYNEYCGPDDIISKAIDNAATVGTLPVIAGGNSGYYGQMTIGSPGTARSALTVAASMNNIKRNSTLIVNGVYVNSTAFLRSKIVKNLTGELEVISNDTNLSIYDLMNYFQNSALNVSDKFVMVKAVDFYTDWIIDVFISRNVKGIILYNTDSRFIDKKVLSIKNIPVIFVNNSTAEMLMALRNIGVVNTSITVNKDLNFTDGIADYSSIGPVIFGNETLLKPDISAPGDSIVSTFPGGGNYELSGTSMATPHVAAVAALVKQARPSINPQELKLLLMNSVDQVGNFSYTMQGAGRVNLTKAIKYNTLLKNKIITGGKAHGNFILMGEASTNFPDSQVSLHYGAGVDPKFWNQIPINSGELVLSNLTKNLDSLRIADGYYTIRLNVSGNSTQSESRSLIEIDNNKIKSIEEYEIYNANVEIPISLDIAAIRANSNYLTSYRLYYSKMNSSTEFTDGLKICSGKVGKEQISYPIVNCNFDNGERNFLFNTSSVTENGLYKITLVLNYADYSYNETIGNIYLDKNLRKGFPKKVPFENGSNYAGYLTPLVSDLDNDGDKEIVVNIGRNGYSPHSTVRAYNHDGSILFSKDIGLEIVNDTIYGTSVYQVPVIADIDGDGKKEVVQYISNYYSYDQGARLYAINASGEIMPGFPIKLGNDGLARVMAYDFDKDGDDEIIAQGNTGAFSGSFMAIIKDGVLYRNWTLPPSGLSNPYVFSTVGNFDEDIDLEYALIVCAKTNENLWSLFTNIQVYNLDGSSVIGWPVSNAGFVGFSSSPSSGDIDGDGIDEIIFPTSLSGNNTVTYYNHNGLPSNFSFNITPQLLPEPYNYLLYPGVSTSVTLFDIDKDGKKDVFFGTWGSYITGNDIYAVYSNGTLMNGWPKKINVLGGTNLYENNEVTIADVDGDGNEDILISGGSGFPIYGTSIPIISSNGGVYAWHKNGTLIKGFPYPTSYYSSTAPTIVDLDNDGKLEMIASSNYEFAIIDGFIEGNRDYVVKNQGGIYVWNLPSTLPLTSSLYPNELDAMWTSHRKDSHLSACTNCTREEFTRTSGIKVTNELYTNFTVEVQNIAKIVFNGTVNMSKINVTYLENNVIIRPNYVYVNSNNLSMLNTTSTITFENVIMNDPKILRDGIDCTDCIASYNSNSKIYTARVNSFSSYSLVDQTPVTPTNPTTGSGSGGGGGGGGGGGIKPSNPTINERETTINESHLGDTTIEIAGGDITIDQPNTDSISIIYYLIILFIVSAIILLLLLILVVVIKYKQEARKQLI